jgi:hypothetical protein
MPRAAKKHAMIEEREADWRLTELEDRFRGRENEMQTRRGKRESEVRIGCAPCQICRACPGRSPVLPLAP